MIKILKETHIYCPKCRKAIDGPERWLYGFAYYHMGRKCNVYTCPSCKFEYYTKEHYPLSTIEFDEAEGENHDNQ